MTSLQPDPIVLGMARALFVTWWADQEEEAGRTYPGQELMAVAPETPQAAFDEAWRLVGRIEERNHTHIRALLYAACQADGLVQTDGLPPGNQLASYSRDFGHYLAMQSLGHGVSWFDDHAEFPLDLPLIEVDFME